MRNVNRYDHIIVNYQGNVYYHSDEDFIPLFIIPQKLTLLIFYHFLSSIQMLIIYRCFVLLIWDFHNVKELSFFEDIKKTILTLTLN